MAEELIDEMFDDLTLDLDFHSDNSDLNDSVSESSEESLLVESSFMDKITNIDYFEIVETIHSLIDEYLQNNILSFSKPGFHDDLIDEISHILFQPLLDAEICADNDYNEVREHTEYYAGSLFECGPIPFRQESENSVILNKPIDQLRNTVEYLRAIPQPKQRTAEWYDFRHNMLTASNLWKAFTTESQYNSLIYEKCKTINMYAQENSHVNTESPLHWGVKYEPLTVMVYEMTRKVKVEDFGCIRHHQYPFLGASPDGIVVSDHLYGHMVEIKNIVNREIDGIPSEAYWIQMQLQMETCGLDICDFVETRFKEYESEEEFYGDETNGLGQKGVILYFISKKGPTNPYYMYMPLEVPLDKESIDIWSNSTRDILRETHALYTAIYWRLDEYSCIQVRRNRVWFESAIPKIEAIWKVIEKERIEGFEHRAAKKRKPITEVVLLDTSGNISNTHIFKNIPTSQSICLVKLDGEE